MMQAHQGGTQEDLHKWTNEWREDVPALLGQVRKKEMLDGRLIIGRPPGRTVRGKQGK